MGKDKIIEPGYRPPFDPIHASDAEIDALVRNDKALETVTKEIAARFGEEWPRQVGILMRLAEGGRRAGYMAVADNIIQRATSLARGRVKSEKDKPRHKMVLLKALLLQGAIRHGIGKRAEAMLAYRESLEMSRRLAEDDPSNADRQRSLSVILVRIGDVLRAQGDLSGALAAYQESLEMNRRLAEADPSNADLEWNLSTILKAMAQAHDRQGDQTEAIRLAEESLVIRERLAALDRTSKTWEKDVTLSRELVARLRS